jgi:hypothetical protein
MSTEPEFDANVAVFMALATWVAKRDHITVNEAGVNLANLFNSPEVQDKVKADEAAKDDLVKNAVSAVEAAFAKLRADLHL